MTLSRLISVTAPRLSGRERTKGVLERLSLTVQGPVAAMQRLESVAPSEPAHADRTKQSLGRANELWSEWRLCEVVRPYDLHEAGRHPRAAASLLLQLAVPTEAGIPTFPLAALNRSSPAAAWDRSGLGFSAVSDRWQLRRRRGGMLEMLVQSWGGEISLLPAGRLARRRVARRARPLRREGRPDVGGRPGDPCCVPRPPGAPALTEKS